ncbi:MAG: acyl-ACP desaturase [Cyanothece sp. SIO1E1]|nr:acyl-ACP desaturase [Cyanothece sp. SIO1E1]
MSIFNIRLDVMKAVEKQLDGFMEKYLIPIDKIWQPSDFLPDSQSEEFIDEIKEIREEAKELDYDFWVVLIGDMITEEALPTYESWLMDVVGVDQQTRNPWAKWVRHWTAEENRHGDVLNKYLFLSGRTEMKEVEKTIQYLIADGFDIGTGRDPYKNFVYTSFQELATHISHKRVSKLALDKGNQRLGNMCRIIAGDEMRHYLAYREFVKLIFEYDPSQMMLAFADMMKRKIVMPAHFIRESGQKISEAFVNFSDAAQRMGVYTSLDYVDIMKKLTAYWDIEHLSSLTEEAEKARDYVMNLPARLMRVAERLMVPETPVQMQWVKPNGMM